MSSNTTRNANNNSHKIYSPVKKYIHGKTKLDTGVQVIIRKTLDSEIPLFREFYSFTIEGEENIEYRGTTTIFKATIRPFIYSYFFISNKEGYFAKNSAPLGDHFSITKIGEKKFNFIFSDSGDIKVATFSTNVPEVLN